MIIIRSVNSLLGWSANYFTKAVFSVYEQINPFDGFGQVMLVENLIHLTNY